MRKNMTVLNAPVTVNRPTLSPDGLALRSIFNSIHAESCPHIYNFHMHTKHSDGQLPPERLAQQVLDLGLKGFAITDHHQITGSVAAQTYLMAWQARSENQTKVAPQLWTGTEITSSLLDVEVHILGYGFDPGHHAIASYLEGVPPKGDRAEAAQVIAAIQGAGGLAVLAHPARYRKSKEELLKAIRPLGIDGIETYYAYNNPKPWQPSPIETREVEQFTRKHQLFNTCGTDTHGLNLLQRV
jgi:predicted metal-dependent phosphoesterase TrpH